MDHKRAVKETSKKFRLTERTVEDILRGRTQPAGRTLKSKLQIEDLFPVINSGNVYELIAYVNNVENFIDRIYKEQCIEYSKSKTIIGNFQVTLDYIIELLFKYNYTKSKKKISSSSSDKDKKEGLSSPEKEGEPKNKNENEEKVGYVSHSGLPDHSSSKKSGFEENLLDYLPPSKPLLDDTPSIEDKWKKELNEKSKEFLEDFKESLDSLDPLEKISYRKEYIKHLYKIIEKDLTNYEKKRIEELKRRERERELRRIKEKRKRFFNIYPSTLYKYVDEGVDAENSDSEDRFYDEDYDFYDRDD